MLSSVWTCSPIGISFNVSLFLSNLYLQTVVAHVRYNFANEGVISTHKNVLAYILCISVVDHSDVTVDEIIYLASEFAGDAPEQYEVCGVSFLRLAIIRLMFRCWLGISQWLDQSVE